MKKIGKATREKENSAREKSEGKFQITVTKHTYSVLKVHDCVITTCNISPGPGAPHVLSVVTHSTRETK